ncbi:MAG: glycoside hydrolase family 88 protein [Ferroplasma sp.]|uniref:glycoside hydrolase family 88 protein n=1 Tax=Ferroplasma sp. TaxID=2591003 RepID=UPI002815192E|nr:glycoside hydrolase family 88 protein [Ferroplasma sp.]WMT50494.1 MAG: glycoside hydrolase family 88 protein [Ferroplasma sp.]
MDYKDPRHIYSTMETIAEKVNKISEECINRFPYYRDEFSGRLVCTDTCNWSGGHWISLQLNSYIISPETGIINNIKSLKDRISCRSKDRDIFLGFIFYYSFARMYDMFGSEYDLNTALSAADTLISMFNPVAKLIPLGSECQVLGTDIQGDNIAAVDGSIIANILLYWAYDHTGRQDYLETAISNLDSTIKIFMRGNFSVIHMVKFDPDSGNILTKWNNLGYSNNTTWSRGQAWFLLALAYGYKYTENKKYIEIYRKALKFYIGRCRLTSLLPLYDLQAPEEPGTPVDASSLAILAKSYITMLELGLDDDGTLNSILDTILSIIDVTPSSFITHHVCFDYPHRFAIDSDMVFADYYILDFLINLNEYIQRRNKII